MAFNQDQVRHFVGVLLDPETDITHFGRKGMKWGEHRFGDEHGGGGSKPAKTKAPSMFEISAARQRHDDRVHALDSHSRAARAATTAVEKQHHVNEMHRIANDPAAHADAATAGRVSKVDFALRGVNASLEAQHYQKTASLVLKAYGASKTEHFGTGTKEEQLVSRAHSQARARISEPAVDKFRANRPISRPSSDPKVNELLSRSRGQAEGRVRAGATRNFDRNQPSRNR